MSSIEKTILAPQAIAVPADASISLDLPIAGVASERRLGIRSWALIAALFLLPLLTYWPTTFHDYGLRDDYSNLREAHEEPGVILKFCASHARPIYGLMLQATYGQTDSVQNLQWMRFVSALLLGVISVVMFKSLRSFGWSFTASLCFAVLVSLIPSAQVIASWAIGWPYAVTALLAIGGFFAAEGAMTPGNSSHRTVVQGGVAIGLMILCALIYQPSALFYVVPMTAALIVQRDRSFAQSLRWLGSHLFLVVVALGSAYSIMTVLYSSDVFVKSGRIAFEHQWAMKSLWFLQQVLPNTLNIFVLNDDNHRDHVWYIVGVIFAALILIAGCALEWRRHGRARGIIWTSALCGVPLFACMVSIVASEHFATYRTIFAMTSVLVLFMIASVKAMLWDFSSTSRRVLTGIVLAMAIVTARHHAYALLAVPQGNEWQLIVDGAKKVRLAQRPGDMHVPRIFAIASSPADISTATIYHDEFGSLSSNSEWVPREMFKRAIHDLHPDVTNLAARYDFATGPRLPVGQRYDVIIDLHRLRRFYTDN
jgi:hypothetical protein